MSAASHLLLPLTMDANRTLLCYLPTGEFIYGRSDREYSTAAT